MPGGRSGKHPNSPVLILFRNPSRTPKSRRGDSPRWAYWDSPRLAKQSIGTVARLLGVVTNMSAVTLVAAAWQGTNPVPQPSDPAAGTVPVGPAGTVPVRRNNRLERLHGFRGL